VSADITLDPGVGAAAAIQAKADSPSVASSSSGSALVSGAASPPLPNPRLTVDPGLNRVVLEFFNSSGVLTNTIPSQKQLEAYRLAAFAGHSSPATDAQGS